MSTINLHMRKRCTMDAVQMWLDRQQPGLKVVDVSAAAPCELTVVVEDEPRQQPSGQGDQSIGTMSGEA